MVDFNRMLQDRQLAKQLREKQMATRSNVKVNEGSEDNDDVDAENTGVPVNTSNQNDDDDIPDEMDMSKPTGNSAANGSYSSTTGGLSLEELDERGFDEERDEAERIKLTTPEGDWEKKDAWKFEKRVYAGDCMPGDLDPAGRTVFSFSGQPKPKYVGDVYYTPTLFVAISPDYRVDEYSIDKPGGPKPDGSYKRFLAAKDLYLAVKGEKCTSPRKLINFMEHEEYVVRTANYDGNTRTVGLKKETGVQRRRS